MPAPTAAPRATVASFRVDPDERDRIRAVANQLGLTLSELIRQGIARMEADLANSNATGDTA